MIDTGTNELLCEVKNGVAVLTLNRPEKRNSLSDVLTPALREMVQKLDERSDVRCLVITGEGGSFCAGGDLGGMSDGQLATGVKSFDEKVDDLKKKQRTLTMRIRDFSKPTIAAVSGPAAGAGFSIALACDIRLASRSAFVTTAFSRIGLSGDYGGSWLLTQLVGTSVAKSLYFTSRRVGAEEGYRLGIFNEIYEDEDFRPRFIEFAEEIAQGAPIALELMKQNLNRACEEPFEVCLDYEAENLMRCAGTDDHKEAVSAFLEKRKPNFSGK